MHPPVPDDVIPPLARLEQARDDLSERDRLLERVQAESAALDEALAWLDEAREVLATESHDVERLEGATPSRLLASLRGTRDADLDRERDEVGTAAAAVEHAAAEVERRRQALASMSQRAASFEGVEAELERALEMVAQGAGGLAESQPHAVAGAAAELSRRRELREVDQALVAGREAMSSLVDAMDVISSADSWSAWDTFGGGGMLSSMMKHERLDEARGRLETASEALERLTRELDDLNLPGVRLAHFDGLTRGVDIWFDNIFTDMAVRSEIKKCRRALEDATQRVWSAIETLDRRRVELLG